MIRITPEEIDTFREQFSHVRESRRVFEVITDCEGDLEDATLSLAIEVGQQPDRLDFLNGLAKRYRVGICQSNFRHHMKEGVLALVLEELSVNRGCPVSLAIPVVIYAFKQGIDGFCEPLELKV